MDAHLDDRFLRSIAIRLLVVLCIVNAAWTPALLALDDKPSAAQSPREIVCRVTFEGKPVRDVTIYTQDGEGVAGTLTTDAKGEALANLQSTRVLFVAYPKAFAPQQKAIDLAKHLGPVEFALDRGKPGRLSLIDKHTKLPLPGVAVLFLSFGSPNGYPQFNLKDYPFIGVTDDQGALRWENTPGKLTYLSILNSRGIYCLYRWDSGKEPDKKIEVEMN